MRSEEGSLRCEEWRARSDLRNGPLDLLIKQHIWACPATLPSDNYNNNNEESLTCLSSGAFESFRGRKRRIPHHSRNSASIVCQKFANANLDGRACLTEEETWLPSALFNYATDDSSTGVWNNLRYLLSNWTINRQSIVSYIFVTGRKRENLCSVRNGIR